MKNLFTQIVICLLVFITMNSCSNNDAVVSTPIKTRKTYPLADKKLWTYFEKFEEEAKLRNLNIDLVSQNIHASIEPIAHSNVGLCNRAGNNRTIIIDQDFWESRGFLSKELIVFHELGHCSLNLFHRNDQMDGICKSIMRAGQGECFDNYTVESRSEYLDELFLRQD